MVFFKLKMWDEDSDRGKCTRVCPIVFTEFQSNTFIDGKTPSSILALFFIIPGLLKKFYLKGQ